MRHAGAQHDGDFARPFPAALARQRRIAFEAPRRRGQRHPVMAQVVRPHFPACNAPDPPLAWRPGRRTAPVARLRLHRRIARRPGRRKGRGGFGRGLGARCSDHRPGRPIRRGLQRRQNGRPARRLARFWRGGHRQRGHHGRRRTRGRRRRLGPTGSRGRAQARLDPRFARRRRQCQRQRHGHADEQQRMRERGQRQGSDERTVGAVGTRAGHQRIEERSGK